MKFYRPVVLFSMAIFCFTGCFINHPASSGIQESREGDEYFSSGNLDKAIEKWIESLNYKQNVTVYEKIVMAQIIKNDLIEAEIWIYRGLTYFPNNVNLAFNLALIMFYKEDFAGAMDNLEKVLDLNKYYPNAHFLKGLIYEKKGDGISARKEFVNEININPGSKRAWQKLRGLKND